jgi:hypothetical protein
MRATTAVILFTALSIGNLCGQTRTITGIIIDEDLQPIFQAQINDSDTGVLAITDIGGKFKINLATQAPSLMIRGIGMESKMITVPDNCSHLEIIMLNRSTYDFVSLRKVDRNRKRQFDKLPRLHQAAFNKGIFKNEKPCYTEFFLPIRGGAKIK